MTTARLEIDNGKIAIDGDFYNVAMAPVPVEGEQGAIIFSSKEMQFSVTLDKDSAEELYQCIKSLRDGWIQQKLP